MRSKSIARRLPPASTRIHTRGRKRTPSTPSTPTTSRSELAKNARVATRSRRPHHTIPVSHAGAAFDLRNKYTSRTWPPKLRLAHKGKKFDFVRVPADALTSSSVKYRYQSAPGLMYEPSKAKVSFDVLNDRPGKRSIYLDYLYFDRPRNAKSDPSGPAVIEAIKSIANTVRLQDYSRMPDPSRPAGSTIPRYLTEADNLYPGFDRNPRDDYYHQQQRRVLQALRKPVRAKLTASGGKARVKVSVSRIPSKEDVQWAFFDDSDMADRIMGNNALSAESDYAQATPMREWQRQSAV